MNNFDVKCCGMEDVKCCGNGMDVGEEDESMK